MPAKSEQHMYEINSWLRTLDYLQQENIYMKNSVAAIIKNNTNPQVLEKIEFFQNSFLNKDTVIAFLRSDIYSLQRQLVPDKEESNQYETLRLDMKKMEQEFNQLRSEFINYMPEATG